MKPFVVASVSSTGAPRFVDPPVSNTNHLQPCQAFNLRMVSNIAPDRSFQLLRCLSLFSNTTHFPSPCLSLIAPKPTQHQTVHQSPMLGERSLPKMARPLRLSLLGTQGAHPQFSYCEQSDVCSFLF